MTQVRPGAAAHRPDRGRQAHPRGADLQPSRQPSLGRPGRGLGAPGRAVVGPRRGRRRPAASPGPSGSVARRRSSSRSAPGSERPPPPWPRTPRPQRAGLRGLASRCRRDLPDAREEGREQRPPGQRRRGLVDGAPVRAGEHRRALDVLPRPVAQAAARPAPAGERRSSRSAGRDPPAARCGCGGWPPTGRTTPTRWRRCSAPRPLLEGGRTERWADRPRTRFERRGIRASARRWT